MLDLSEIVGQPERWRMSEPMSVAVEVSGETGGSGVIDFECLVRHMLTLGNGVYVKMNGELHSFRRDRVRLKES